MSLEEGSKEQGPKKKCRFNNKVNIQIERVLRRPAEAPLNKVLGQKNEQREVMDQNSTVQPEAGF